MWLALREGNAVYRMELDKGTIHHVAGTGKKGFTGNGGPAKKATLSGPKGIAVGPKGNIYLADTESHSVRMIDLKTGKLELIAGDGKKGDGPEGKNPKKCRMDRLHGVFVDKRWCHLYRRYQYPPNTGSPSLRKFPGSFQEQSSSTLVAVRFSLSINPCSASARE